jgi:phosphoribosylaminoimidazole (AIR) synthetase
MYRVFNMGIGLVMVVSDFYADSITRMLSAAGHPNWVLGEVKQLPADAGIEKRVTVHNK